jgi:transcriptional regulator with XRE-family HTH domain
MTGRGSDNLRLRSIHDARVLFLLAVSRLESRLLKSLGTMVLPTYRQLFRRHAQASLSPQRASRIARAIGFEDEFIDEDEVTHGELGDEYEPVRAAPASHPRYLDIQWRDPHPSPKQGEKLRRDRIARGLSIVDEARRLNILPSELVEMEQGYKANAGLTTMSGAEPVRRKLRSWAERWHLEPDWCLDWALEQLRTWPLKKSRIYALDPIGILVPPLLLPAWFPQLQTRELYLRDVQKAAERYCDKVERLIKGPPAKRGPGNKRHAGRADRHFYWLAAYQVCGLSQNAIAEAEGIDQAAVNRAVHRLADSIELELRAPIEHNPSWTIERIQAALVGRAPL